MFGQKTKRIKALEAEVKALKSDVDIYSTSNLKLHGELIESKNKLQDLRSRCYIRNTKGQIEKYNICTGS